MPPTPSPPQSATLDQSVTITWSDGSLFSGFLLLGLVVPSSGGTAWAELDLGGQAPGERIPLFTKIPVINGKFDNTVGVLYNTSISPPETKYAAWYYDQSVFPPRQIAGPTALFTVSSSTLTPPAITLPLPTAGVTAPTPDTGVSPGGAVAGSGYANVILRPDTDSTAAISVQTSAGTQFAGFDSTNRRFFVGTTGSPTAPVSVNSNTSVPTTVTGAGVHVISSDAGLGNGIVSDGLNNSGRFLGRIALGTAATPSAVTTAAFLSALAGRGYLTNQYSSADLGQIAIQAEGNFSNASAPTGIIFNTTPSGSTTIQQVARIDNAGRFIIGQQGPGGIVNQASAASAGIELQSTTRAILLSRMTTAERDAMSGVVDGMIIYNTSLNTFQGRQGGVWTNL